MLYKTHYKYGRDALMLFTFTLPTSFTLGTAKGLAAFAACHPERSEGSGSTGGEMLRYAQHDKAELILSGLHLTTALCVPQ
jgi:hypothetical protein